MKKRLLSLFVIISIVCTLVFGTAMEVNAYSTISENNRVQLTWTEDPNDDYMYLYMSWNTDNAVLSTTSNSNIRASYLQLYFPARGDTYYPRNISFDRAEKSGGLFQFYFTPDGLQNTNGKMEAILQADNFPYMGELVVNGISSTRSIGGSVTFYHCDKDGNKLSGELFKLKVGQKTYPTTDTVDFSTVPLTLEKAYVDGPSSFAMPTDEDKVETTIPVCGNTKYGLDAAEFWSYYYGGEHQYIYGHFITEATVTNESGEDIPGVYLDKVDYKLTLGVTDEIYDSIGDATSVPITINAKITTNKTSPTTDRISGIEEYPVAHNMTLERPQFAIKKNLENMTTDIDDFQYCRMAIEGKIIADEGHILPDDIIVKIGETKLSSSQYTYNKTSGDIKIPAEYVTDAVEISGTAYDNIYDAGSDWTEETDAGYILDENNQKKGIIRFIFDYSPETDVKVEKSGIMYIASDDFLGEIDENTSFSGASGTGTASTFYGDLYNIPEEKAGTRYYGVGYVVADGKYYWSDPIGCLPDFRKLINY